MTTDQLQHIQQVPLDQARFCADCKLIHNCGNSCPLCACGSQESVAVLMHRGETQSFKSGQRVMVENKRYHGEGVVDRYYAAQGPLVYVKLQNGNVWPYEAETVSLVDAGQWRYERERIVPAGSPPESA